jgi:hypothetical protein
MRALGADQHGPVAAERHGYVGGLTGIDDPARFSR